MRSTWILAAAMLLPSGLMAQKTLPDGTILPISLNKGLNALRVHEGQEIRATVMQDISGRSSDFVSSLIVLSAHHSPDCPLTRFACCP
jgi:hypothetical protein